MLLQREKSTALHAVERLAGMQAQVARPPFIGLWTRIIGFRRDELREALGKRRIVRVTAMRGTLHLMSTADYLSFRGALQPMLTAGRAAIVGAAFPFDAAALERMARQFFGKAPATFDVLRKHLKTTYPKHNERHVAYAIRNHVPLVQMPTDAPWSFPAAAEFMLADQWLGKPVRSVATPPTELVRRYLAAFGPATPGDAQAWSGLVGMREVFEDLRSTLVTFRDERKRELFDLPDAPRPPEDTPAPVRYVPEFDNLVLAHQDRTRVLADEYRQRVTTPNLLVRGTFLVDGFVAGIWTTERKKTVATLGLEPFVKVNKKVLAELEEEGDKLLAFVEEDAARREFRCAPPK
jgi:hypothetical protein